MSTAWIRVDSPDIGSTSTLRGVGSITADAVWSVGSWTNDSGGESTLTQFWNGLEWQIVESPNGGGTVNVLWDVDGVSATDLWAVGYSANEIDNPDMANLIMLRGDGRSWTTEPVPAPGPSSALAAIELIGADDGWAVGTFRPSRDTPARALILRWTGTAWITVEAPDLGAEAVRLTGVSATGSDNAWAVGYRQRGPGVVDHVILHWDGQVWTPVPGPALDSSIRTALFGVAAVSASDAWAVGYSHPRDLSEEQSLEAFAIRWDGKKWIRVASADPLPGPRPAGPAGGPVHAPTNLGIGIQLRSVIVHDTVWVAGYRVDTTGEHEAVMAFDGTQFRPEILPAPGDPTNNVTGTALSAIAVSPVAGQLWTVGWVTTPTRVGHGANILTRQVPAKKS